MIREIISQEFQKRKKSNPSYSLRAFARDLEISPAFMSGLIKGSKSLSEGKAREVAEKIGLSKINKRLFLSSAVFRASRSPEERKKAKFQFQQWLSLKEFFREIPLAQFRGINHWKFLACLEAIGLSQQNTSPDHLLRRFGLRQKEAEVVIERLTQLGLLRPTGDGEWNPVRETDVSSPTLSKDIQAFHVESMKKSLSSFSQPIQEREYLHSILAVDPEKISEAKKVLREFVDTFNERFASPAEPAEVYQLGLQFVSLEKKENV